MSARRAGLTALVVAGLVGVLVLPAFPAGAEPGDIDVTAPAPEGPAEGEREAPGAGDLEGPGVDGASDPDADPTAPGDLLIITGDVQPLAKSDCSRGKFCVWRGEAFSGSLWRYTAGDVWLDLPGVGVGSLFNNRVRTATLYEFPNRGGRQYCLPPFTNNAYVAGWARFPAGVVLSSSRTRCG